MHDNLLCECPVQVNIFQVAWKMQLRRTSHIHSNSVTQFASLHLCTLLSTLANNFIYLWCAHTIMPCAHQTRNEYSHCKRVIATLYLKHYLILSSCLLNLYKMQSKCLFTAVWKSGQTNKSTLL